MNRYMFICVSFTEVNKIKFSLLPILLSFYICITGKKIQRNDNLEKGNGEKRISERYWEKVGSEGKEGKNPILFAITWFLKYLFCMLLLFFICVTVKVAKNE